MGNKPGGRAGLGGLVAANAVTAVLAAWQGWPLVLLLWPYWVQGVLIGWYARKRVLALPDERNAPGDDAAARRTLANFMIVHYGIFQAACLALLFEHSAAVTVADAALIAVAAAAFWWGHRRSHALNIAADSRGGRNPGALMLLPYVRVLPMQLAIVAGALFAGDGWVVGLFCLLKTAADVLMHIVEHRWLQRAG